MKSKQVKKCHHFFESQTKEIKLFYGEQQSSLVVQECSSRVRLAGLESHTADNLLKDISWVTYPLNTSVSLSLKRVYYNLIRRIIRRTNCDGAYIENGTVSILSM